MAQTRIAVDAMGGDHAPRAVVEGSYKFALANPAVKLLLFGEEAPVANCFKAMGKAIPANIEIVPCGNSVEMGDKPVDALRRKQDSSVVRAVESIPAGNADAFFSAGNTGICVAATTLRWRTLRGVIRPGIAIPFPTISGASVVLDMGANVDAKSDHLLGYAVMGSIYASAILGKKTPRVALLNIGSEENKGSKLISGARDLISATNLNYVGYIEGNDLMFDKADVIVCDGFVGNLVLKTVEGVIEYMLKLIKTEIKSSPLTVVGGLLSKPAFKKVRKRLDYSSFGGAQLLGVNGVCIIAHGRSDPVAIYNGLAVSREVAEKNVNDKIVKGMAQTSPALVTEGEMNV